MSRSSELLARAARVIPGGVNSPVRAFRAVGGDPPFIRRAEGVWLYDEDDRKYLDFVCSWGAILLGHANPLVLERAMAAAARGSTFGAPTEGEIELAEALIARVEGLEMVRLVSSGTEATMHAIRLARGVTGRPRIVKIDGHYHGAHDAMLVNAGSGLATFAIPGSPGVPDPVAALTLVAPNNDLAAMEALFEAHPGEIAAIILEPISGNMGCMPPRPGYLEGLRALCDRTGALLILDEVMTGFRTPFAADAKAGARQHEGSGRPTSEGTAQARYGVVPDLSTFGKVVGGGYPLAAYGGRRDLMSRLAPVGPIYQAGTLSGNPVAVAAGLATLQQLDAPTWARLEAIGARLEAGVRPAVEAAGYSMHRVGSMFTIFFQPTAPWSWSDVKAADTAAFGRFFRAALAEGLYLPASQFEAAFLSARLTDAEVDHAIGILVRSLRAV